ncbi:acetyl-CoA carboxylase biotin carboxyl carrier protein subunit [Saccharopolyspora indica]|uniref:acetyl-CoA carboxylase biotin carboxyl carrier protein n=1 Tax=Saccharopolyspora indica TaxID=1229659 RepID=UPI0022EB22FB|nr:biotin/lipoyl-containing protein [Saccharopolyspora indica]MDA3645750.1 acetyl-CoA carboxylase biotin carboxyl carrier protein subunit [Saccharopolyspora indica]
MTQSWNDHLEREFGGRIGAGIGIGNPAGDADLLDRVTQNAIQLLAGSTRPPRSLRISAGDVSVGVEWPEEPVAAVVAPSAPAAPVELPETGVDLAFITAETVGVFYHAPKPGAPPFVSAGDLVAEGAQVGIIEVMKMMIPVTADRGGRVIELIKADGQPVEHGEKLLSLDPAV